MEVMRGSSGTSARSSRLNPAAPPYVPASQRAVEDFSSEWWQLVTSSPGFADYWLRECFQDYDDVDDDEEKDPFLLPDDVDELFYPDIITPHQEEKKGAGKGGEKRELVTWGAEKWKAASRGGAEVEGRKYAEKAPRMVLVKVSPRTIQQPR